MKVAFPFSLALLLSGLILLGHSRSLPAAQPVFEEVPWYAEGTSPVSAGVRDIVEPYILMQFGKVLSFDTQGTLYRDNDGDGVNDLITQVPDIIGNVIHQLDPKGMNRKGVVVGSMTASYSSRVHPFRSTLGGELEFMTHILGQALWADSPVTPSFRDGGSPTVILDIDDQGRMLVGDWCALFTPPQVTHLVDPPTVEQQFFGLRIHRPACYPMFMNNRGKILARVNLDGSGRMVDIANPGSFTIHYRVLPGSNNIGSTFEGFDIYPFAFNDSGRIAMQVKAKGAPEFTIVLDQAGNLIHRIEDPTGDSLHGEDMNNKGQVVGYTQAYRGARHKGFLFLPAPDYGLPAGLHFFSRIGITHQLPTNIVRLRITDSGLIFARDRFYRPVQTRPQTEKGSLLVRLQVPEGVTVDTADGIDIHRARVGLYLQDAFVRTQRAGETDSDYHAYLAERQRLRRLVAQTTITPADDGQVVFRDIPRIDTLTGIRRTARYTLEATQIETDEIDIEDPTRSSTVILHFGDGQLFNLVPVESSPPEIPLVVLPADVVQMKQALIAQLSRISPNHYLDEETRMATAINAAQAAGLDAATILSLRRAILAERVLRDSGQFTQEALKLMLKATASVIGALFDKLWNFKRADIARREAQIKRIENTPKPINAFGVHVDPERISVMLRNTKADRLIEEGRIVGHIVTILELLKPKIEWLAIQHGLQPDAAAESAAAVTRTLKLMAGYLSTRTLRGTVKNELKLVITNAVKSSKGYLFDNAPLFGVIQNLPDISHTGRTVDLLRLSREHFETATSTDEEAFRRHRANLVDRQLELHARGKEAIDVATTALLTSEAFNTATRIFDLGGVAFKQLKAASAFSGAMKKLSDLTAIVQPAVFVFGTSPGITREAVLAGYGQAPP